MTHEYTVVLMRPDDEDNYLDSVDRVYVAVGVEAADCHEAEFRGKREVWGADRDAARDNGYDTDRTPEDYTMLCIFVGKHNPKWFGFQPGFNSGLHPRR